MLFRTGFRATEDAAIDGMRTLGATKKIFQDRLIHISPMNWDDEQTREEDNENGTICLNIYGVDRILSLFEHFGNLVTKIKINYEFIDEVDDDIRQEINENVIKKYSNQFTELHVIVSSSFSTFLDQFSIGGERIHFPNVKKLVYQGPNFGNSYDLNSIFPNLESLHFYYNRFFADHSLMQLNMTCMENVSKLKELNLQIHRNSYTIRGLEHFLMRNEQLSTLKIVLTDKIDILRSIEAHAINLKTLEIQIDSVGFLDRVSEKHPFNMPNLKRLNLRGICDDSRIIKFINNFQKLETLDVWINSDLIALNMEKLIDIHEFITFDIKTANINEKLEKINAKNKLNMVKWAPVDQSRFNSYNLKIIEMNKELKRHRRPTWKANYYKDKGYSYGYMMLMRT